MKKHPDLWCSIAILLVWTTAYCVGAITTWEVLTGSSLTFLAESLIMLLNYAAMVFAVIVFDEAHD